MKRTLQHNQQGMVAILVTMIMIFVITLIVLGFAEVSRHNSREALDTALGTQAYYAAETGVNDVVNSVKGGLTPASSDCGSFPAHKADGSGTMLPRELKADHTIANTCLLIDSHPTSLVADTILPTSGSILWDVKNAAGAPFKQLTFSWAPDPGISSTTCNSAVGSYPPAGTNGGDCNFALLRVDIVNAATPSTDAATLAANTATVYIQPSSNNNPVFISDFPGNPIGQPLAYQGACIPSSGTCTASINFSGNARQQEYYLRVTATYAAANKVTLTGVDDTGPVHFTNGQIVVDSTGRAQDELKRIQVRIDQNQQDTRSPIFGVQGSQTICKDLRLGPTSYSSNCSW